MNGMWIRVLGLAATGLGFLATLLGNWVDDQKTDAMIEEKVAEALAKQNGEEKAE